MATLTWKGATAREALGSELLSHVPAWQKQESLPRAGARRARRSSPRPAASTATRTTATAARNLGAPDLTDIGSKNLGVDFQIRHLKCPSCVNPGSPMPQFESLGEDNLRKLAVFLEASKGKK